MNNQEVNWNRDGWRFSTARAHRLSTLLLAVCVLLVQCLHVTAAVIENLRCEYLHNPLGVDALNPRLSWELASNRRGEVQTAYRVLVASSQELLKQDKCDLWDSGRVASDQTTQLEYAGKPLASGMKCFWKVCSWDKSGKSSGWSRPSMWSMGLLKPSDWQAKWIGLNQPDPSDWPRPRYLRREFELSGRVRQATIHATALGVYELRLNGKRVGDQLLAPEWTNYRKHVQYQTYDVTGLLHEGPNAIGAILGNGWYCGGWQKWKSQLQSIYGTEPYFLTQLEVLYEDGRKEVLVSDESWTGTSHGPFQFAGIYEGVTYVARLEMKGWDEARFTNDQWISVNASKSSSDLSVGKLVWQRGNPIRVTQELKPVSVTEPKPGIYVFAFDQNMVGCCRFRLQANAGDRVEIQHGEMLNRDGTVFTGNLCVVSEHRCQLDRYIFRGNGEEMFEPRFTYHGFQYVEVRGLKKKPSLGSVTGLVFHSTCPEVGEFTCSEPLLNRLAQNILWSQRANYMGVPTDCPQRNERCGYTGDAQFFMRAAVYNMDVSAFFNRWLVDVCEDAQMTDGHFADHAPTFGPGDGPNIGWSDGGIICPYEIYRNYGDTRVIREHYLAMKRKLEWLDKNSRDGLFVGKVGNGDWLNLGGGANNAVIGTAYAAFDFRLMSEMADAIGENADAAVFRDQAQRRSKAFIQAYVDGEGKIRDCSQTAYAMAFTMGLVPEDMESRMADRFEEELKRFDWHPATGFIGTPRLLPALHKAGRDADAYRLLLARTSPSWLYPVTVGATTIWERWDGWNGKDPKGGMNSLNHYSFGAVGEYLYGMIGGIQPDAPGYQRIRIQPVIGNGMQSATTRYDSIHGKIVTQWKVNGKSLDLDVTIPANTHARVVMPALSGIIVTESGKPIQKAECVKAMLPVENTFNCAVGSGTYHFHSTLP